LAHDSVAGLVGRDMWGHVLRTLATNFFVGQTVEITGVAGLPKIAFAEGTFDYRAYLRGEDLDVD